MILDGLVRPDLQPAVGPPGPRVLAVLVLLIVAGFASLFHGVACAWSTLTHRRPESVPVEIQPRKVRSQSERV